MSGRPARTNLPAGARRERSRGSARRRTRVAALLAGLAALLVLVAPAAVLAHPLGNFTINHFAGLRIAPDRIALDVVIDRAEIPAFQELQRLDPTGAGTLTPDQAAAAGRSQCTDLAAELHLAVDDARLATPLVAAGLSLPPGAGGLSTMRLVCEYEAVLAVPIGTSASVAFEDTSFAERIGWREIVVLGDGATVAGVSVAVGDTTPGGVSARLTSYPSDLLAQPLDVRAVQVEVSPGGPPLEAWTAPDARPLQTPTAPTAPSVAGLGIVPGGITEDLSALINLPNMSPIAVLVALAVAFGLGIVHALSPGHGKTIMAAYLVGGRGSSRQAVGLGLAVAVSHTLGVLVLALITLAASSILPPERLYPILGLASGALVVVIGASLLWARLRAWRDGHGHAHGHAHDHADEHGHAHGGARPQSHEHSHPHAHGHAHPHPHEHAAPEDISWRGLIALGLSGGLVPSASALILLLGSIAAGMPAYGLVLVVAFGLGMAVVLGGIGFALVHARRFVERRAVPGRIGRLAVPVQVATASLVVVLGVVLTGQALGQVL
jgi:ABC-type nickel/cobalt efflux system permease component RcnA